MKPMGVLKLADSQSQFSLTRHLPAEPLRPFVKHYWIVRWDLRGREPFCQDVVPNPCVNLVIEPGQTAIYGASTRKFTKYLSGRGLVFGVKFHPGGFYPFYKRSVAELSERPLPPHEVFDVDSALLEQQFQSLDTDERRIALADQFLLAKLPEPDPAVAEINRIIDLIITDPAITKVDQVCERLPINKRKLQRLFDQYVGVSPKWVIKLYRLHNAAERLERGQHGDLALLAAELGYYDQSHFIKDFKAIIGETPLEYASTKPATG
ncbi:AraC-like DNA-binding protein [Tumebacillus sp. BK434]|uniref:helix-turn-helix domain-containing protein n=1 Tax=Tumebacillus sp. BK434 TaxID=2512169 RepID=UPI00104C309E|nr:helix-turn-helix domain-containing protein [Tumebacillus sp. BK434]TCP52612.1 AraC-like DNA-binding protein [Tumebacillus sp. BK434]